MQLKIKVVALESALEGARNVFPNEFIGFFRGEEKENEGALLTELVLAPLSDYGDGYSSLSPFHDWITPHAMHFIASFHSHPHPPARPSKADIAFFSRAAKYHFIACPPFSEKNTRAFDANGKEIEFKVV